MSVAVSFAFSVYSVSSVVRNARNAGERFVIALAVCASVFAFLWHFQRGDILLDGDAVAHINIARRVFDSKTLGPLQLGTVWLPLPHVLIIPFVISDWAWISGVGGSVPSLAAYVFAVWGIFRLTARGLGWVDATEDKHPTSQKARDVGHPLENLNPTSRKARDVGHPLVRRETRDVGHPIAGAFVAALFGLNPNLLYLQATAMTESLYLSLFIWAVVFFMEFAQRKEVRPERESRPLRNCALCLMGAMLTRYDGWFLAAVMACVVVVLVWREAAQRAPVAVAAKNPVVVTRPLARVSGFLIMVGAVPMLWLAYNWAVFGNPLEFATGRYSARAIAQQSYAAGVHSPGFHDLPTAVLYFMKTAQLDMGAGGWGRIWLLVAVAGSVLILARARRLWPWLMLWSPLAFYALSIAYAGAGIHVPEWWPFTYYNLRYGVQLTPAIAVFSTAAVYFTAQWLRSMWKLAPALLMLVMVVGSYGSSWTEPICLTEARVNSRSRIALETALAKVLSRLPHNSTLLMYTGGHVGALQRAGIPLQHVITEGNHGDWKHPLARHGLWEQALDDPARYADYAIGFDDDEVTMAARKRGLRTLTILETTGQPPAAVYATGR